MKLIGELRKEKEFRQQCCRNSTKIRREKDKKVERERRGISATLLPKFLCPNSCPFCAKKSNCGNAIAENGKKKFEWNYGNVIAENGRKKNLLPKFGMKFLKKCYVHNIFIILPQQITGD